MVLEYHISLFLSYAEDEVLEEGEEEQVKPVQLPGEKWTVKNLILFCDVTYVALSIFVLNVGWLPLQAKFSFLFFLQQEMSMKKLRKGHKKVS